MVICSHCIRAPPKRGNLQGQAKSQRRWGWISQWYSFLDASQVLVEYGQDKTRQDIFRATGYSLENTLIGTVRSPLE